MKIILDCNIWISFLIGHQTNLIQQILTDTRFEAKLLRLIDFRKFLEK